MQKSFKSIICLIILLISFTGNTITHAATYDNGMTTLDADTPRDPGGYTVGHTYTFTKSLTLSEIDTIAEGIYDEQTSSVWSVCSIIAGLVPAVSSIYSCLSFGYSITASNEYKFYANIRTKMINNSYRRVSINYQRKYCRKMVDGKYVYYFELTGHSVKSYQT